MENTEALTEMEKDLNTIRMLRTMYRNEDHVHAHTIIALCGILEKYLLPKLSIGKKLYEPKTHAPQEQAGPTNNIGTVTCAGHGETAASPIRPECEGGRANV